MRAVGKGAGRMIGVRGGGVGVGVVGFGGAWRCGGGGGLGVGGGASVGREGFGVVAAGGGGEVVMCLLERTLGSKYGGVPTLLSIEAL